eukprot:m.101739 g.101739  ORF g.101739 m.101739 type:complete len:134 (+) comp14984_c1_seq5:168-569(+)
MSELLSASPLQVRSGILILLIHGGTSSPSFSSPVHLEWTILGFASHLLLRCSSFCSFPGCGPPHLLPVLLPFLPPFLLPFLLASFLPFLLPFFPPSSSLPSLLPFFLLPPCFLSSCLPACFLASFSRRVSLFF